MSEAAIVQEAVASPETVTLADCSRAQIEQRYVDAVNALMDAGGGRRATCRYSPTCWPGHWAA